ncbi:membrane protein insertase YidC [Flexithrix dorotheae]|uniref:membrane protein insertase YidC n=1 Tax=Flexithrix dorotheae TaxID=70993 RepID=UPI00036387E2|nr:membrane protein insertase YidC [Flexithrix dorotheae]
MDKNNLTGLLLISLLLVTYFYFFSPEPPPPQQLGETPVTAVDSASQDNSAGNQSVTTPEAVLPDSVLQARYGFFGLAMSGEIREFTLENDDVKFIFTSKGGMLKEAILKNYVTNEKETLVLIDEYSHQMSELIPNASGQPIDLNQLYYEVEKRSNTSLIFRISAENGSSLERIYNLEEKGFVLNYDLKFNNLEGVVGNGPIKLEWNQQMKKVEKDLEQSRQRSTVNYYMVDESFDYLSETSTDLETAELPAPAKWVSMKQKFFNSAIITDDKFENVVVSTNVDERDLNTVKDAKIALEIPLTSLKAETANIRYYYGPNDYDICETVAPSFERNVYLGWSLFSSINLYLIIPVFEFLENYIANYGIIILILVFIVKTLLFPLTYKSYISMAKMKVLKPELDELKEKHGEDMTKMNQEQMKLYQQVGVNPISGCIPMLLQLPVFLAMFNFFPNAIQLRQEGFLWATDLSTYDSIMQLPFAIPAYGSHVSLFTLLMTISQIAYTYYNNQINTAAAQGPMKSIGYITPVMFMFFLNNFASGLTYYYFLNNMITIGQQLVIRNFIDDKKIRQKLEENKKRNKDKKKSKFQQRLEDAMKSQENQKAKSIAQRARTKPKK